MEMRDCLVCKCRLSSSEFLLRSGTAAKTGPMASELSHRCRRCLGSSTWCKGSHCDALVRESESGYPVQRCAECLQTYCPKHVTIQRIGPMAAAALVAAKNLV